MSKNKLSKEEINAKRQEALAEYRKLSPEEKAAKKLERAKELESKLEARNASQGDTVLSPRTALIRLNETAKSLRELALQIKKRTEILSLKDASITEYHNLAEGVRSSCDLALENIERV